MKTFVILQVGAKGKSNYNLENVADRTPDLLSKLRPPSRTTAHAQLRSTGRGKAPINGFHVMMMHLGIIVVTQKREWNEGLCYDNSHEASLVFLKTC